MGMRDGGVDYVSLDLLWPILCRDEGEQKSWFCLVDLCFCLLERGPERKRERADLAHGCFDG